MDITLLESKKESTNEIVTPFRSEYNFLKYPFFDLYRKSKRNIIQINEKIFRNNEQIELSWKVSRNIETNFPSVTAKKIHKYLVEKVITELPKPIINPIRLGSLSDICKGTNVSTGHTAEIKDALKDIVAALVESKGTFYSKSKKIFIDDTFHLYDRIIYAGQELPNGEKADAVYIVLGNWILENINAGYTVPLDWAYHRSLKGDITSRMYELLSLDFFVALEHKKEFVEKDYLKWCPYFPIIPQDKLFKAKKQLKSSFKQHLVSSFFADEPEFIPIPQQPNNWIIRFYIGEKAILNYQWAKKKSIPKLPVQSAKPLQIKASTQSKLTPSTSLIPNDRKKYIEFLKSYKVNNAEKLVNESPHPPEIMEIIVLDFMQKCTDAKAGKFKWKKTQKDWLCWAFSSIQYNRPNHIKTPAEILEEKKIKEEQDNAWRKPLDESNLQREYQDTYIQPILEKFKNENKIGWDILYKQQAEEFIKKAPRKTKEWFDEDPERVMFKEAITGKCVKVLKKTLNFLSFEDWLKNRI